MGTVNSDHSWYFVEPGNTAVYLTKRREEGRIAGPWLFHVRKVIQGDLPSIRPAGRVCFLSLGTGGCPLPQWVLRDAMERKREKKKENETGRVTL